MPAIPEARDRIVIDHEVPVSRYRHKYPFEDMKIGDSFYVEGRSSSQIMAAADNHKTNGRKYTARKENVGARIWRVA